jgi:hypothetical protein
MDLGNLEKIKYSKVPISDHLNLVAMAKRIHPFPSRTRKLSSLASMVLHGRLCGRVERRQIILQKALTRYSC